MQQSEGKKNLKTELKMQYIEGSHQANPKRTTAKLPQYQVINTGHS